MATYLIVSSVFPPEPVVSARTSADLANALVQRGDTVTVITSYPSRPGGKLYPGFKRKFFSTEDSLEYGTVIRCLSIISSKSQLVSRFLENWSFGLTSAWRTLLRPRPMAIYVNTWPIIAAGLLMGVAKLRRIPVVLSIQDIYPESLLAQGRIYSRHPIMSLLGKVESYIARQADRLILISEGFADTYKHSRGVDGDRISIIPNWVDSRIRDADTEAKAFRKRMDISESTFLLVYGGNVGAAAGLSVVLEALMECRDLANVRLLIAGEGSRLDECRRFAMNRLRDRVIFYSPWPAQETCPVLGSADLLLLPTCGGQTFASVPSKLISYMLAARPVLAQALSGSETARLIKESKCGWVVDPDRPELLEHQLRLIVAMNSSELTWRGTAGRAYAEEHLAKEPCLGRLVDIMLNASSEKGAV